MRLRLPDLPGRLRGLLGQVPPGCVTTRGALAEALGSRHAARWVGHFLLHHDHDAECPCYRVLMAGGRLGPCFEGPVAQRRRLSAEGVRIVRGVVDLERYGQKTFRSDRPLARLARLQEQLAARVVVRRPRGAEPRLLGGVDVSYPRPHEGIAAYALIDVDSGELIWSTTIARPVRFPYITSYLTFRELPILLDLIDAVRQAGRIAPVVLVDGSGMLHPRRAGIASHLGVAAEIATIGVTKKLLCGQVDIAGMEPLESRPVLIDDEPLGAALRPTSGSRRPLFISPGHRVDLAFAEQAVRRVLLGRRLPEPIYWADRLSRGRLRS